MVFDEDEFDLELALEHALLLVNKKDGPILGFYKNPRYNDEPLLYQYTSIIKKTSSLSDFGDHTKQLVGGTSIIRKRAVMKALGEAIERYCLAIYKEKDFIVASKEELGKRAMDIETLVCFSPSQLKTFKNCRFNYKTKFRWIEGYSLTRNEKILLPAQLIFIPYKYRHEPIIRLPISTGAACGTARGAAIERGIFEIIERDSFMIFYLNELSPKRIKIDQSRNSMFIKIREMFQRYNLELYIFDITTDLKITSIMTIIVDRTGIGPAVAVGLKASSDSQSAIIGTIEEAQQIRSWMRDEMSKSQKIHKNSDRRINLVDKGLWWSKIGMINKLDFFLKSNKFLAIDDFIKARVKRSKLNLNELVKILTKLNMQVIYVDITRPEVASYGFSVVKVIIPQLHPLYLDEKFKYLGGNRLYNAPIDLGYRKKSITERQLNPIPHPFL